MVVIKGDDDDDDEDDTYNKDKTSSTS